jgi:hypothetical protein
MALMYCWIHLPCSSARLHGGALPPPLHGARMLHAQGQDNEHMQVRCNAYAESNVHACVTVEGCLRLYCKPSIHQQKNHSRHHSRHSHGNSG